MDPEVILGHPCSVPPPCWLPAWRADVPPPPGRSAPAHTGQREDEINMGMKQNQQKMVVGLWKPETKPCKLGFKPESSSKLESWNLEKTRGFWAKLVIYQLEIAFPGFMIITSMVILDVIWWCWSDTMPWYNVIPASWISWIPMTLSVFQPLIWVCLKIGCIPNEIAI